MENLNLERPTGDFGFLFGQPAHPASAHLPARRPDPTRESPACGINTVPLAPVPARTGHT